MDKSGLAEDVVVTPAGGAQKITCMVALLATQGFNLVVLLDSDHAGNLSKNELLKQRLISEKQIIRIATTDLPGNRIDIGFCHPFGMGGETPPQIDRNRE